MMSILALEGVSAFSNFVLAGVLPAIILIGAVVAITIGMHISSEKTKDDLIPDVDDSEDPIVPTVIGARITNMCAESGVTGVKSAKHYLVFTVTFLTDENETLEFRVPEEDYTTMETDQTGTLVYVGDTFYEFGDGEEITEETEAV